MGKPNKVKLYKQGDSLKTVCEKCRDIRISTLYYRDYLSPTTDKVVHNVLQAFCDDCGELTAIPDQSVPKIREYSKNRTIPLEIRIPPQLEDVIYILSSRLGIEPSEVTKMVLGFYVKEIKKEVFRKRIVKALDDEFAGGKVTSRISLRILKRMEEVLDHASGKVGLNRSQLIKAILLQAKVDLLDHAGGKTAQRFYGAARLMAA